jgi:DNA invertase Pin-like site-specific DNA recombinase
MKNNSSGCEAYRRTPSQAFCGTPWNGGWRIVLKGEDSPMANLMLSVMGAFAEFERALLRERQREGIALAKKRGTYRGRQKALADDRIAELRQRAHGGEPKAALAREFGISRETLYQYLRAEA